MNLIDFFKMFGKNIKLVYNLSMETMEIIEQDTELAKNQIAFDLDNIPDEVEEEESASLPQDAFESQSFDWVKEDVLFVVVKTQGENKLSNFDSLICGRPLLDWVVMAGGNCEKRFVSDNANIIDVLKTIQTDKPYMAVFYSDTPLLSKAVYFKIMDYFVRNRLNAMTLLRGYVFKTDFLKSVESFMLGCLDKFDEQAFMRVKDGESYKLATTILQSKILDYHERNGVTIFDRNTTVVDADVEIGSGVVIKSNNIIKGKAIIMKDAILEEGNVIANSIIGEGCNLVACRVVDSKISNNKKILGLDISSSLY